jgi:hypothetical protein
VSEAKPIAPRFYFDADVLGLAKLVCRERPDCTYPGDLGGRIKKRLRPPCIIDSPNTLDTVWIPAVAAQGWLIITRDRAIQEHRAEVDAVRTHNAKVINLAGPEAVNTWAQLEVLMTRWRDIEPLADQPGPFIYSASRSRLRRLDLTQ